MTFALLIYASKLNADDEKKSELQNPSLSENYLKAKFKWHIHDIYADEDTNQKIGINPKEERYLKDSEAVGFIEWWNFKEDKYPNRMKEFWESEYFGSLREDIYNNYLCDEYGLDDDLNQIKIDFDYKKYDEDSIEAGKKLAAIVWNAWEIFNRRAPYWNNKFLKSIEKEHLNRNEFFPNLKSPDWFGPSNTNIKFYNRVKIDPYESWRDIFESEDGDTLKLQLADEEGGMYLDDQLIDRDTDTIYIYSQTEEFKKKVSEFYKKLEKGDYGEPIEENPKDINTEDMIAYKEAHKSLIRNKGDDLPF